MPDHDCKANLPLTLEQHFTCLAKHYPDIQDIQNLLSLWHLLRKDLEDRLPYSRGVFAHYSLHDASHSRSVIQAIERFLGEERIRMLSATDTFMLLCCAYAHDYGMAVTYNQIYEVLGKREFLDFLEEQAKSSTAAGEDVQAVKNLLEYVKNKKVTASLQDQYRFIMQAIQMYLRPLHWKGAGDVWRDFQGLLTGRINERFIRGGEGIIDICEAHGQPFERILDLNIRADGIVGDDFHPRFIAAMLRLGDLLDLDNGRFPRWFVSEIGRNQEVIPKLSRLHYKKHEAINHLLITPKRIEVCAACSSREDEYEVAGLVQDWIQMLKQECDNLGLHWSKITQANFGRPPLVTKDDILLDGKLYTAEGHKLQMQMPQERVMKLLEGTNIYRNKYIGIRELVQNAVDASLLQLWYDITHNRYIRLGISKYGHLENGDDDARHFRPGSKKEEMGLLEHNLDVLQELFGSYPITIELVKDLDAGKVFLMVKDRGIGITPQDARYMADIGASKEKNVRIRAILKDMPRWMKPSGVFGIGLQSVFQLTDRIEFYSRRPNEPERKIVFNSYGRNHGRIEVYEITPDQKGIYYDNTPQGTNVKIAIDPERLLSGDREDGAARRTPLLYYDMEFSPGDPLQAVYAELSQAIMDTLRENPYDYFNIYYQPMIRQNEDTPPEKGKKIRLRPSYFSPNKEKTTQQDSTQNARIENSVLPFYSKGAENPAPFSFTLEKAYYMDEDSCRSYQLNIREGVITQEGGVRRFELPSTVRNLYNIQYKFNPISNADFIYPPSVRQLKKGHAGFLRWNIHIMDENPDTYLNIDRDRLREGSIVEEELEQIQRKILLRWCDYLIRWRERREVTRLKEERRDLETLRRQEREQDFETGGPANLFKNRPQLLVSFALLFYQYVPAENFRAFIEPYQSFLEEQELILNKEEFPVQRLWEAGAVFQSEIPLPPRWVEKRGWAPLQSPETESATRMKPDTLARIPHRLIHIFRIFSNERNELTYRFRFGQVSAEPCAIEMDYVARLHDYGSALKRDYSSPSKVDFDSLVSKAFKPNKDFPHLLVLRNPKPFERSGNFASPMDHYIRWYILSPFDRPMTRKLRDWMKSGTSPSSGDLRTIIQEYAATSPHMEKCVNFAYKQCAARLEAKHLPLPEDLLETVKKEYRDFLLDCCRILLENRELIISQFSNGE